MSEYVIAVLSEYAERLGLKGWNPSGMFEDKNVTHSMLLGAMVCLTIARAISDGASEIADAIREHGQRS